MSKGRKSPKILSPLSKEEIEPLLREFAEALSRPRSTEDRRELVMSLLARRHRRAQIVSIVCRAFETTAKVIDEDIRHAKDKFIEWATKKRKEEHMADSAATMDEAIQRAFKKDDLQAAVAAQRHRDSLLGLARDEDTPIHPLGVVILPEKIAREEWEKRFKTKK